MRSTFFLAASALAPFCMATKNGLDESLVMSATPIFVVAAGAGATGAAVIGTAGRGAEREADDAGGREHPARRARGRNVTDVHGENSPLSAVLGRPRHDNVVREVSSAYLRSGQVMVYTS